VCIKSQLTTYSNGVLTNIILVSQSGGLEVTNGNTVTMDNVLWYRTPITILQEVSAIVKVRNQRDGDPVFALDGYHILTGPAAIDVGDNAGVTMDVDNQPRPHQLPDLGADEFWPPGALILVYLPVIRLD